MVSLHFFLTHWLSLVVSPAPLAQRALMLPFIYYSIFCGVCVPRNTFLMTGHQLRKGNVKKRVRNKEAQAKAAERRVVVECD